MFTRHIDRGFVQSAVCLLLAITIVSGTLAVGALGVESLASNRAIVTITQIA
ncbi:MAG TPA: hypothetical protein PKE27_05635 [Povalibacter sp.]|uniref:hypothetical protein n=1 Tax=Povalibacter sp. TaxID=1962978 RepID=UPI002CA9F5D8|nr:hypothetical protein [Povalibacter sp.]HMN44031.1 hypothetical protein [Povalibacter sp.]